MDELIQDDQLTQWFSSYGLITAERILGKYHITLPQSELINAIKSPFSFYHKLLKIPLKNVLNGIVLQQASDYHIYAQKLFIDYLLSGESGKSAESQGALTRESLENERQNLVALGENFHQLQLEQNEIIANSQASLIKTAEEWRRNFENAITQIHNTLKNNGFDTNKSLIRNGINSALIHCDYIKAVSLGNKYLFIDEFNKIIQLKLADDIKDKILSNMTGILEILSTFDSCYEMHVECTKEMAEQARSYRTQFYDSILRAIELIKILPEYKIDPEQDLINREPLYFDKTIGEN